MNYADVLAERDTIAVAGARLPRWQWPSTVQTWLRLTAAGRGRYGRALLPAAVVGGSMGAGHPLTLAVFGATLAWITASMATLFVLYGPPSTRVFRRLFALAGLHGDERVVTLHLGSHRGSRSALEHLPRARVHAIGILDPGTARAPVRIDIARFDRPPVSHPRFVATSGRGHALPRPALSADVVLLGDDLDGPPAGEAGEALMAEVMRVLAPGGAVLVLGPGRRPLATLCGRVALRRSARAWRAWLDGRFGHVEHTSMHGVVDLLVARQPGAATASAR